MAAVKDLDYRLRITPLGNVQEVEDEDVVKQSIKTILSTIPGERVRQPQFGSPLYEYLFEPMTPMTIDEIRNAIETALQNFEDRIVLRDVDVVPNFDRNFYEISVRYYNNILGRRDIFNATVRVLGDE